MTEPTPPRGVSSRARALWVIGMCALVVAVAVGVIVGVSAIPAHHKRTPVADPTSPTVTQPATSPATAPSSIPASSSTPASASRTSTPSDPQAALKHAIIAAWVHAHSVQDHYFVTFDGDMTALGEVATGDEYSLTLKALENEQRDNTRQRGPTPLSDSVVTSLSETKATVCSIKDWTLAGTVDATTGKVVDAGPGGKHPLAGDLVLVNGVWKVSAEHQVATC